MEFATKALLIIPSYILGTLIYFGLRRLVLNQIELRQLRRTEQKRQMIDRAEQEKREKALAEKQEAVSKLTPVALAFEATTLQEAIAMMDAIEFAKELVCRSRIILQGESCNGTCIGPFHELVKRVRGNRPPTQTWTMADTRQLVDASLRYAMEQIESSNIGKEA